MKRKSISKILFVTLLSFSTILSTGCDSTPEETYVEGISIKSIDSAVVGEKLNLKDYVKIDGNTEDFEIELISDTKATFDEDTYELTIISEGKIKLFVRSGDKEKMIEFNAISKQLNIFKNIIEGLEYNFFLGGYDIQTGTISPDGDVFNENYQVRYSSATSTSEAYYEGYIFDEKGTRAFTIDDLSGNGFEFLDGKYSPYYYTANQWQLYYDLFETKYYSANEAYLYGGMEAAEALCSTLGFNTAENIAKIYRDYMIEDGYINEDDEVSMAVYVEFLELPSGMDDEGDIIYDTVPQISLVLEIPTGSVNLGVNYYLLTDEASCTLDFIEEIIDTNAYPELTTPTTLIEKINSVCEQKNYTIDVHSAWTDLDTGEDTDYPEGIDESFLEMWFDYDVKQYVTEDTVYSCFPNDEDNKYTKYSIEGEKVFLTTNIDDASGDINTWGVLEETTHEETSFDGIWTGSSPFSGVLGTVKNNQEAISAINVTSDTHEDSEEEIDYILSAACGGYKFLCALMKLIPFCGSGLANVYSQEIPQYGNASIAELYLLHANFYISNDELVVKFMINWNGSIGFITTMTFTNIGSTTIPA